MGKPGNGRKQNDEVLKRLEVPEERGGGRGMRVSLKRKVWEPGRRRKRKVCESAGRRRRKACEPWCARRRCVARAGLCWREQRSYRCSELRGVEEVIMRRAKLSRRFGGGGREKASDAVIHAEY